MKKYLFILSVMALLLSSCAKGIIKLYNIKSPVEKKAVWQKNDRTIIFLPMVHLSKQAYYDEVKEFVTQKRKEGYVIYYEGIGIDTTLTQAQKDTIRLKFRKMLRFDFFNEGKYKNNPTLPFTAPKKYVAQTLENTGIDPKIDVKADLTDKQVIDQIEAKRGKIVLDSCDFATPLDQRYKCKRCKSHTSFSIRSVRDDYVNSLLSNTSDKKIVLVYGAKHRTFIDVNVAHKMHFELVEGKSITAKVKKKK